MAIPVNIDELVNQRVVESTRIEYKSSFNPEPIVRSICAFANDIDNIGGGYIIIGIEEENGAPKFPLQGVPKDSIDGTLKKLREYCHYIEPLYEPIVEPVFYKGVHLIVIWVPGGYGRPYKAPAHANNRQSVKYYYIRKFSSSVIASAEEEKELFYISSNIPFDDRPNLAAEPEDLDLGLIREHLKEIGSALYEQSVSRDIYSLAGDMQLLGGPPERQHPLNVGILMFCEHPEKYFRYARIEVVDIPDPTGTNMTEKLFTGPIQRQLKDALSYIKNYVIRDAVIKVPGRAEAVKSGEIRSKIYRNRRIGDFLKELKLIEGRNTGFPNARKALSQNGSPDMRFEMNPERDYLSVILPIHQYFSEDQSGDAEYERKIISLLTEKQLSMTELAHEMGYKGITAKLKRTTEALLQKKELQVVVGENRKPKLVSVLRLSGR